MTTLFAEKPFPRSILIAGGCLMLASLGLAAVARYGNVGTTRPDHGAAIETRHFTAEDRAQGGILLRDAKDGRVIVLIEPGDGGFIRGVLRGFARDRRAAQLGTAETFVLARRANGLLTLEDTATGRVIDLEGFGSTNREAFAKLLPSREAKP
jgi:putative photosynthetic complex assembly protein